MRSIAALRLRYLAGVDVRSRRGMNGIDAGAPAGGVTLRGQQRNRVRHPVRVAKKQCAIGISALHRLDHQMQRLRRVGARDAAEIIAFKNIEHLDQNDSAG